jgi:hypothetical protein
MRIHEHQFSTDDIISLAWNIWQKRLQDPSADHGHRLAGFRPFIKDEKQPLCRNTDGSWNQDVPGDTIVVELRGLISSTAATMGYFRQG